MAELQVSAVPGRVFARAVGADEAFHLPADRLEGSHDLLGVDFEIQGFISVIGGKPTSLFPSTAGDGSCAPTTAGAGRAGGSRGAWLAWVAWGALGKGEHTSWRCTVCLREDM